MSQKCVGVVQQETFKPFRELIILSQFIPKTLQTEEISLRILISGCVSLTLGLRRSGETILDMIT